MKCLGIETTAHTFGAGVSTEKKILSNELSMYKTERGGMLPREAADHHYQNAWRIINNALKNAKTSPSELDCIGFSQGPGMGAPLRIGAAIARYLSLKHKKPLVGVNHCIAHLVIGKLLKAKDPVMLYVSGANTQVIALDEGRYRIFGETLDNGVGNMLDAFARSAGIGFPGGPVIEKLALKGKRYVKLPYTVKGMDISVGGLLTNLKQKLGKHKLEDLCHSLQETLFSMLVEVSERAMAHCNKKNLLLTGGVAANKRLQEMCKKMCRARNARLFAPPTNLARDNGAMIAYTALLMHKKGYCTRIEDSQIRPRWRTDQVKTIITI